MKESDIVKMDDPLVILAATASEVDVDEASVRLKTSNCGTVAFANLSA